MFQVCLVGHEYMGLSWLGSPNIHFEQRIRGVIDARIAEEQARQKATQGSLSRSNSNRRPAARATRPRRDSGAASGSPDPTEFEPEFAIADDDTSGRSSTPQPESSAASDGPGLGDAAAGKGSGASTPRESGSTSQDRASSIELPTEVRVKLRRLDKLESKYHGKRSNSSRLLPLLLNCLPRCNRTPESIPCSPCTCLVY
jgi:hypothetical protein